ncbi:hypothetical protein B0H11DRAFT_1136070 [Mycena galericulata]|nr:hypothetical protein B0H11DRAFT_1136070 [Mycena galericulata]
MSTPLCSSVSSRRPSLAMLYSNLKAQSDPYEELQNAARLFPMEDDEVEYTYNTVSSGSTPSPRYDKTDDESDAESDNSSDSDSDVEPMDLISDAYRSDFVHIHNDTPFMPPRQLSPGIIKPLDMTLPFKPLPRQPPPRIAPSQSLGSRRQRAARASASDEDSDHDADCESTGDASDDEYVPSPTLNPRKRTRSASPGPFRRTAASPAASSSALSSSTDHPNKRARLPPPSRNKQATLDEIQRVESSDDYNDFVCRVCGWVQKNGRLPDFKRHVKTHQRAFEEEAQKGWRCKGVLLSEAARYRLGADAPTYKFLDQVRVGGCMKTFSRRDALKRHLDNVNVSCVGHPTAPTQD